jgi:hypothetical protein
LPPEKNIGENNEKASPNLARLPHVKEAFPMRNTSNSIYLQKKLAISLTLAYNAVQSHNLRWLMNRIALKTASAFFSYRWTRFIEAGYFSMEKSDGYCECH